MILRVIVFSPILLHELLEMGPDAGSGVLGETVLRLVLELVCPQGLEQGQGPFLDQFRIQVALRIGQFTGDRCYERQVLRHHVAGSRLHKGPGTLRVLFPVDTVVEHQDQEMFMVGPLGKKARGLHGTCPPSLLVPGQELRGCGQMRCQRPVAAQQETVRIVQSQGLVQDLALHLRIPCEHVLEPWRKISLGKRFHQALVGQLKLPLQLPDLVSQSDRQPPCQVALQQVFPIFMLDQPDILR